MGVDEYIGVTFRYVDEERRELRFTAHGRRYEEMVAKLKGATLRHSRESGNPGGAAGREQA